MTTTAAPPYLALARRRLHAYRAAATAAMHREVSFAESGLDPSQSGFCAAAWEDAGCRYRELLSALELAQVFSASTAREAGLSVWIDAISEVGVEVEGGGIER